MGIGSPNLICNIMWRTVTSEVLQFLFYNDVTNGVLMLSTFVYFTCSKRTMWFPLLHCNNVWCLHIILKCLIVRIIFYLPVVCHSSFAKDIDLNNNVQCLCLYLLLQLTRFKFLLFLPTRSSSTKSLSNKEEQG